MNLFTILKDILKDKTGILYDDIEFEKEFDIFMITRYLSMRSDLICYANYLNQYSKLLSKKDLYLFLIQYVPRSNNYFIKYLKKKKKENVNESQQGVENKI